MYRSPLELYSDEAQDQASGDLRFTSLPQRQSSFPPRFTSSPHLGDHQRSRPLLSTELTCTTDDTPAALYFLRRIARSPMDGVKRGLSSLWGSIRDVKQAEAFAAVVVSDEPGSPAKRVATSASAPTTPTRFGGSHLAQPGPETAVGALVLAETLVDADSELHIANAHISAIEEEWSEKMGEYIRINAQLRVEVKQSLRKATSLEAELKKATERIASLEQALTEVALDTSYSDAKVARSFEPISVTTPVASLGEGHGGVALGMSPPGVPGAATSVLSLLASPPPSASASEDPTRRQSPVARASPVPEEFIATGPKAAPPAAIPGSPPLRTESPPRLALEKPDSDAAAMAAGTKSGGCCIIS